MVFHYNYAKLLPFVRRAFNRRGLFPFGARSSCPWRKEGCGGRLASPPPAWSGRHAPGEGDVPPRHLLQVVDGRRLAGEAVVGVVVGHDGGGSQLAQLAVGALQLQLDGLQLRVLAPVHWRAVAEGHISETLFISK